MMLIFLLTWDPFEDPLYKDIIKNVEKGIQINNYPD